MRAFDDFNSSITINPLIIYSDHDNFHHHWQPPIILVECVPVLQVIWGLASLMVVEAGHKLRVFCEISLVESGWPTYVSIDFNWNQHLNLISCIDRPNKRWMITRNTNTKAIYRMDISSDQFSVHFYYA